MNRILIGATGSGLGKTTLVCGLLKILKNRGVDVCSFKCGPDYIDPMFHKQVLGIPSRNLDLFFMGEEGCRYLLAKNGQGHDLALMEGVMGYYDGLGGTTDKSSAYDLARATATPTILLVDGRGKSLSILAEIEGYMRFRADSQIRGVIINRMSKMTYSLIKPEIEQKLGVKVVGYMPPMEGVEFESRHLGLVTAQEVTDLAEKMDKLAAYLEETLDIDEILEIASTALPLPHSYGQLQKTLEEIGVDTDLGQAKTTSAGSEKASGQVAFNLNKAETDDQDQEEAKKRDRITDDPVKIGVAMDKAFCFYYEDNLDLLRELGAEIEFFSPLEGGYLASDLSGMILGGGYPELYGKELEESPIRHEMWLAIQRDMPCLAECGGFMFLHDELEDKEGNSHKGMGLFVGDKVYSTDKLKRFGYIDVISKRDSLIGPEGTSFKGHEFHYWESTDPGQDCIATKPISKKTWDCIIAKRNLFAGFPHIHFYSNPKIAKNFVDACREFRDKYLEK